MKAIAFAFLALGALGVWSCGGSKKDAANPTDVGLSRSGAPCSPAEAQSLVDTSPDAVDCNDDPDATERPYCCASSGDKLNKHFPHIQEAFCRLYCDDEGIYCIDAHGEPLDDEAPRTLVPNQQLIVRVVADPNTLAGSTYVLSGSDNDLEARRRFPEASSAGGGGGGNGETSASGGTATGGTATAGGGGGNGGSGGGATLTSGGAGGSGGSSGGALNGGSGGGSGVGGAATPRAALPKSALICQGTCEEYRAVSYTLRALPGATQASVRLLVTTNKDATLVVQRRHEFNIDRGKFYYELGFMVPVTFDGQRKASLSPVPGTMLQTLQARSDPSWAFGLGVIIYPLGVYDTWADDPRAVVRGFAPLGIGLGTNLYSPHSAFKEAYFTLNYRFAFGVVLGVGVTALQGDYFKDNYASGDLLPADRRLADVVDTSYHFRPNLTLTLSADVIHGFIGLISQVNSAPAKESSGKGGSN